ncbi:MAG: tetratricopeptide repeat protein, partial [Planctomycetota bacterium]
DALAAVEKGLLAHPGARRLEGLHVRLLLETGRVEEAARAARAATERDAKDVVAWTGRGLAEEERGRRKEALEAYEAALGAYDPKKTAGADVLWVALAAERITRLSPKPQDDLLQDALKLIARYRDAHPDDEDALLLYADTWQQDRGTNGQAKAAKYYRRILDVNSEVARARVGLARTFLVFWQQDRAIRELDRALRTNPHLVPALTLLASIHVGNGDYESAEKLLKRALDVNPRDKETRAVQAAKAWIRGERTAYEGIEKAVLGDDPTWGRFYVVVSELVGERQRRYDVAADLARRGVETDPHDGYAYTVLGEALMNLGQTDEARKIFRQGVVESKRYADVRRDNWLTVLDYLDGFRTRTSEHFVVRMHPSEFPVLEHYLPGLLEDAWKTLSAKYGYTPDGTVRVDCFPEANDFSVRSIGVPGLPALGVCFGRVITLLGPTARPVGAFSWSRTAWHEFTHTITLGESKGQVPRWLTEGLSVYEEKMRRSIWGRESEKELYDRYRNDRLLRMAKINRAFRGPDIMFAYYQGGLIAEHLTKSRGFDVIPHMLREFAKDRTTAQVFHDVLGMELEEYDGLFRDFVKDMVGSYQMVPRWDDESLKAFQARVAKNPDDVEAWARLGWAQLQRGNPIDAGMALGEARKRDPDHLEAILLEGRLAQGSRRLDLATKAYERFLARGGDDVEVRLFLAKRLLDSGGDSEEAIAQLQAAKRCFPTLIGKASPYLALASLYQGAGRMAAAIAELDAYAAIAGEDYSVRKKLLGWYVKKGDNARVAELCEEMNTITPLGANRGQPPDLVLHRTWARALEALGRGPQALRELEVQATLVRLLPEEERVEAGGVVDLVKVGQRYLELDRPLDALAQAAAAL